jgi:hypothetical protein
MMIKERKADIYVMTLLIPVFSAAWIGSGQVRCFGM